MPTSTPLLVALTVLAAFLSADSATAVATPPRCPLNIETVFSNTQHKQCLADIQLQRTVFYSPDDTQATRALICGSPACTLVLEALYLYELLATPFDSCVLGEPDALAPVVIDSGAIFDLVNNCDRYGLQRSLRAGDANARARALADARTGRGGPDKRLVFGVAMVALVVFLALTFLPRRQEGVLKTKEWLFSHVGLAAPAWWQVS